MAYEPGEYSNMVERIQNGVDSMKPYEPPSNLSSYKKAKDFLAKKVLELRSNQRGFKEVVAKNPEMTGVESVTGFILASAAAILAGVLVSGFTSEEMNLFKKNEGHEHISQPSDGKLKNAELSPGSASENLGRHVDKTDH
jgi:hypothetical protein